MNRNDDWKHSMSADMLPEPFVDATRAAEFLGIKPRRILEMARSGQLPGYPARDRGAPDLAISDNRNQQSRRG